MATDNVVRSDGFQSAIGWTLNLYSGRFTGALKQPCKTENYRAHIKYQISAQAMKGGRETVDAV